MVKKVTKDWAPTLRSMQIGDVVELPVKSSSTIGSTLTRLRLEMCVEGAEWKRDGEIDRKNGIFFIKRIS